MTRGEVNQAKIHFKGDNDDFFVFIDDPEDYQKWREDKSVPLANFISSFRIFVTHGQGNQGTFLTASKATLENQFGTSVDDEVIAQILEKGEFRTHEVRAVLSYFPQALQPILLCRYRVLTRISSYSSPLAMGLRTRSRDPI
ncbi:hypothetical protein ACRALDRAFT_1062710 [Sodiomyces alcalophilus JCM 7366]|uniref:uncharacterized protein n=1 Tax=Sodiomyces alcalophilus JCM 7366 TaxID=591952 RepID=UPI0039B6AE7F